ncbi:MAG: lysophospholipid acyltransferase family protein [Burkholderiales bacterium]
MKHVTTTAETAAPTSNLPVRAFRWTRMLLHVTQGLLVTLLVYPRVTPRIRAAITQAWSAKMLRILNITLSIHGARPAEHTNKLFVVANHVSWLDIFVINATTPSRFVAKSEIRDWPIAGTLCDAAGTIFVHRAKRSDTARINAEIHDALEQGDTVAIFPEGTTTSGDRLLKFHTSLFEPAVVNTALLAPAAIRYRNTDGEANLAAVFVGATTFAQSISNIISQKKMIADITFAPSIATDSLSRRDAALCAENAIAAILDVAKPHAHQRFGDGAAPLAARAA